MSAATKGIENCARILGLVFLMVVGVLGCDSSDDPAAENTAVENESSNSDSKALRDFLAAVDEEEQAGPHGCFVDLANAEKRHPYGRKGDENTGECHLDLSSLQTAERLQHLSPPVRKLVKDLQCQLCYYHEQLMKLKAPNFDPRRPAPTEDVVLRRFLVNDEVQQAVAKEITEAFYVILKQLLPRSRCADDIKTALGKSFVRKNYPLDAVNGEGIDAFYNSDCFYRRDHKDLYMLFVDFLVLKLGADVTKTAAALAKWEWNEIDKENSRKP